MMKLPSCTSAVASAPDHPGAFLLAGTSLPLAGLDDTYWMAKAVWVDGQRNDEGFLIYADAHHYLFLDKEEARIAALVLSGELHPHVQEVRPLEHREALASD